MFDVQFRALRVTDETRGGDPRSAYEGLGGPRRTALLGGAAVEQRDGRAVAGRPPRPGFWKERLNRYQSALGLRSDENRCRVDEAVAALADCRDVLERIRLRNDNCWQDARLEGWEVLSELAGAPRTGRWAKGTLLQRLIDLEVATAAVADVRRPASTVPIELVQLSLRTKGPLLDSEQSGEDKLAGLSLGHFGGFLKRSWRVNDWIWGRLDAAAILLRAVLTDEGLARVFGDSTDCAAVVTDLVDRLCPDPWPPSASTAGAANVHDLVVTATTTSPPPSTFPAPPRPWKPRSSARDLPPRRNLAPPRRRAGLRRRPGRARPRLRRRRRLTPTRHRTGVDQLLPRTAGHSLFAPRSAPRHPQPAVHGPPTHPRPFDHRTTRSGRQTRPRSPAAANSAQLRPTAQNCAERARSLEQTVDSISCRRTPCSSFAPVSVHKSRIVDHR